MADRLPRQARLTARCETAGPSSRKITLEVQKAAAQSHESGGPIVDSRHDDAVMLAERSAETADRASAQLEGRLEPDGRHASVRDRSGRGGSSSDGT